MGSCIGKTSTNQKRKASQFAVKRKDLQMNENNLPTPQQKPQRLMRRKQSKASQQRNSSLYSNSIKDTDGIQHNAMQKNQGIQSNQNSARFINSSENNSRSNLQKKNFKSGSRIRQVISFQQIQKQKEEVHKKLQEMKFKILDLTEEKGNKMENLQKYVKSDKYLQSMQQYSFQKLLSNFYYCSCSKNTTIYKILDDIDFMLIFGTSDYCNYFIESGECSITNNTNQTRSMIEGEIFGVEEILLKKQSSQYLQTIESKVVRKFYLVRMLFLGNSQIKFIGFSLQVKLRNTICQSKNNEKHQIFLYYILQSILTAQFDQDTLNQLSLKLVQIILKNDEVILEEFEEITNLIIVSQGSVKNEKKNLIISAGEEIELELYLSDGQSKSNYKTIEDNTSCLLLTKKDFEEIVGEKFMMKLFYEKVQQHLDQASFESFKLLKITAQNFEKAIFNRNQIVQEKNSQVQKVFLILEGKMKYVQYLIVQFVQENGETYRVGHFLNEEYMNKYFFDAIVLDDLMMLTRGQVACLNLSTFSTTFSEQLITDDTQLPQVVSTIDEYIIYDKLSSFKNFRQFLTVLKGRTFEFSIGVKQEINAKSAQNQIIRYKNTISKINFQTMPRLLKTFKNFNSIFFVSTMPPGIPFSQFQTEQGFFNEEYSAFYIAQIIISLEYLHTHKIIHRYIEPQSLWIDINGFLFLRFSEKVKFLENCRTNSLMGTYEYCAPEILKNEEYSFTSDLWSVGCLLHELMTGALPFGIQSGNDLEHIRKQQKKDLEIPFFNNQKNIKSIIGQLLNKDPTKRLGGSYSELKKKKFFKEINWNNIFQMKPPYIPKCKKVTNKFEGQMLSFEKDLLIEYLPMQEKQPGWDEIF